MSQTEELPQNFDYIFPTLEALEDLGGSGTNDEIFGKVKTLMNLSERALSIKHPSKRKSKDGTIYYVEDRSEAEYRADWARTYLRHYGLIDNPRMGYWTLTSKFRSNRNELFSLDENEKTEKAKEMRAKHAQDKKNKRLNDSNSFKQNHLKDSKEVDNTEDSNDDFYIESEDLEPNSQSTVDSFSYTVKQFLLDTSITPEELDIYERVINRKKQIILAGAPGTGKTFIAQKFAKYLTSAQDGYVDLVQFHPSYTYEDFMRGLKPEIKNGNLTYSYVEGRFIQFCEKAQTEYKEIPCVFIIDEINRANISQVFGELMYLLEYRNTEITLSSGKTFTIPDNVLIIGTMNTADRSIALIDHALRRRFAFIKITPNYHSLRKKFQDLDFPIEKLITVLEDLNRKICDVMGSNDYELGTSFFMSDNLSDEIEDVWQMEVEPYLEEYCFDNQSKEIIESFRWINVQKQIY